MITKKKKVVFPLLTNQLGMREERSKREVVHCTSSSSSFRSAERARFCGAGRGDLDRPFFFGSGVVLRFFIVVDGIFFMHERDDRDQFFMHESTRLFYTRDSVVSYEIISPTGYY